MRARVKIHNHGSETAALTSDVGHTRAFARLAQTGVTELLAKWIEAEIQRPGADPTDILLGFARYAIQTQASLSASFLKLEGLDDILSTYKILVDAEFAKCFLLAKAQGAGRGQ